MSGDAAAALDVVRYQPDQVRLEAFRVRHPGVLVFALGPAGPWQAVVPEPRGSTVITRYTLCELLDELERSP